VDEAAEEGCLVLEMTEGGVEEGATELRLDGIAVVVVVMAEAMSWPVRLRNYISS